MKNARVMAVAVLIVAGLAGCNGSTPTPSAATSEASPSPTVTLDEAAEGFLLDVRHAPDFEAPSDDDLLAAARTVCDALDDGGSYDDAVAPILEDGASPEAAMQLAASAVSAFCDQHDAVIEAALGGPETPEPDPVGDPREQYLTAAHASTTFGGLTDDALLMLGTTYCDGFARGDSLETALGYMEPAPRDDAMVVLTAAVTHICPEHAAKLG